MTEPFFYKKERKKEKLTNTGQIQHWPLGRREWEHVSHQGHLSNGAPDHPTKRKF
jgi:hypothetical protein